MGTSGLFGARQVAEGQAHIIEMMKAANILNQHGAKERLQSYCTFSLPLLMNTMWPLSSSSGRLVMWRLQKWTYSLPLFHCATWRYPLRCMYASSQLLRPSGGATCTQAGDSYRRAKQCNESGRSRTMSYRWIQPNTAHSSNRSAKFLSGQLR